MRTRTRTRTRTRGVCYFGVLIFLLSAAGALPAQTSRGPTQRSTRSSCDMCHGELEFLRQNTPTAVRARAALVPDSVLAGSAHEELACTECHERFGRFPHSPQGETRSCASCHEQEDAQWSEGAHARSANSDGASCAQCHGVHQMLSAQALAEKPGIKTMNNACIGCHQTERLHPDTPHADSTLCSSCHGAHDVQRMQVRTSTLSPLNQLETCGTCHDSIAAVWRRTDAHYQALRTGRVQGETPAAQAMANKHRPPACTDCHGAHGLNASPDSMLAAAAVNRCAECHEDAARTFQNSYHGRATNLGSKASATCADCHGAHDILPKTNAASHVSDTRLVETCKTCHEHARPAFVKYDAHPNPLDRERNPWIFASFWFMNSILIFVVIVFGSHTLLWWWRLYIDKKRGVGHGSGHGHSHTDGGSNDHGR